MFIDYLAFFWTAKKTCTLTPNEKICCYFNLTRSFSFYIKISFVAIYSTVERSDARMFHRNSFADKTNSYKSNSHIRILRFY
jgi:hypothetical protein